MYQPFLFINSNTSTQRNFLVPFDNILVPFYYYKVGMGNLAFKGELHGEEVGKKKLLKQPETLNLCRIFPKAF